MSYIEAQKTKIKKRDELSNAPPIKVGVVNLNYTMYTALTPPAMGSPIDRAQRVISTRCSSLIPYVINLFGFTALTERRDTGMDYIEQSLYTTRLFSHSQETQVR